MKKCPTCGSEFEDSMRFCQVDGATLVDAEPAFDPYATVVGHKLDLTAEKTADESQADDQIVEIPPAVEEKQIHETTGSIPIAPPDEVLELPGMDPLKTMYVSESELKETFGEPEPSHEPESTPPPSPFSSSDAETVLSPAAGSPFQTPDPAPMAEWSPPPAPDAAWQNQEIGSNTPFQPPPAGASGQSKGLATGALVCGILSCLCCMPLITGIAAIIMGFIAKNKADENPSEFGGRGLALGGMVTGAIGILLGILQIIWIIFFNGLAMLAN